MPKVKPAKPAVRARVNTITCPGCRDEIYSRAHHDMRHCSCGSTFVDGGFEYLRYGGLEMVGIKRRRRYVKASRAQLFQDWNTGEDKFGVINK